MAHFNGVFRTVRITSFKEGNEANNTRSQIYFTVASDRPYKNTTGEKIADFITCKAFGKIAELIYKYCGEKRADDPNKFVSRQLYLEGTIETYRNETDMQLTPTMDKLVINNVSGKVNGSAQSISQKITLKQLLANGIILMANGQRVAMNDLNIGFEPIKFKAPMENHIYVVNSVEFVDSKKTSSGDGLNVGFSSDSEGVSIDASFVNSNNKESSNNGGISFDIPGNNSGITPVENNGEINGVNFDLPSAGSLNLEDDGEVPF